QFMRDGVRRITRAFVKNRSDEIIEEVVFQPRISFKLPPPTESGPLGLTAETEVVGYEDTLRKVFGIAGRSAKWGEIKHGLISGSDLDAGWVYDVETATKELAKNREPKQTDSLCISHEGSFYRPIVARYQKYRSNAKNCYLAFIPARDRKFNLGMR